MINGGTHVKEQKVTKDTKSLVGQAPKKWFQKFRLTGRQKKIWLSILGVFIVILVLGTVYSLGYNDGKSSNNSNGAGSILDNIQAPFERIATGQVKSVSKDEIVIEVRGKEVTYKLTNETKVTQGQDAKQIGDVKKGARVTVICSSDKSSYLATKIMIRAN
jgi:hypothetical protein